MNGEQRGKSRAGCSLVAEHVGGCDLLMEAAVAQTLFARFTLIRELDGWRSMVVKDVAHAAVKLYIVVSRLQGKGMEDEMIVMIR